MSPKLKFYADENVSTSIIKGLRLRDVDVLTTKEAGMLGASDEEHLDFANKNERIILTQDDDFLKPHVRGFEHCGIVYAHQRTSIGKIIRGIMLVNQVLDSEEMKNHIEFL